MNPAEMNPAEPRRACVARASVTGGALRWPPLSVTAQVIAKVKLVESRSPGVEAKRLPRAAGPWPCECRRARLAESVKCLGRARMNPYPPSRRPRRTDPEQLKADVLRGLAQGLPLAVVCRRNSVHHTQVARWQSRDPAYAEEFAAARALGWDHLAVECLEIADDSRNDYVERLARDGSTERVFDPENVHRSKLRIETRLKLLACWDTGRYGPQRTVRVEGDVQVTQRHVLDPGQLDEAGRAALRHLLSHAQAQGLVAGPEPVEAEYEEVEADGED